MESIRLRNFRSLDDTGDIKISPLTVLVGQNSSGKSTFVRTFPLLRQGAESRTKEPILWSGRLVDFGSLDETLSKFSNSDDLGIDIVLKIPTWRLDQRRARFRSKFLADESSEEFEFVRVCMSFCRKSGLYKYKFDFCGNVISIDLSVDGSIKSVFANKIELQKSKLNFLPMAYWQGPIPQVVAERESGEAKKSYFDDLAEFIKRGSDGRTKGERILESSRYVAYSSVMNLFKVAKSPYGSDAKWRRRSAGWSVDSSDYQKILNLVLAIQIPFLLDVFSAEMARVSRSVRYITPLRATAERYYRIQGLAVDEIDPQGSNLAMFLHNLPSNEKEDFSKWVEDVFGVGVKTNLSGGHVSIVVQKFSDSSRSYNLADTGFGYSQILPILVQLWSFGRERKAVSNRGEVCVFAIEQPELHLHPRMQAKLADVFLKAIESARAQMIDLRIVVETHSEQIVNAVGLRVAKNPGASKEVNVVFFEKHDLSLPSNVRQIGFDHRGRIVDWPYGFFDSGVDY